MRTQRCAYVSVINTYSFGRFWPVLWTITHRFGVPKRFPWLSNPKVRSHVSHQYSQFWPILASFVDYYSQFWRPGVISTISEPRGAFMCRSSTLTVLSNFGPFRGLLLNVLWPQSDFHDYRTMGSVYVSVIKTHSFSRFWPVPWTITHCFGVPE